MAEREVHRFLLKVLLWLPVAFAVWYYAAAVLVLPVTELARAVMLPLFPEAIDAIEQRGHLLEVVTWVQPAADAGIEIPEGKQAVLSFGVNPLIYGYSLPLFAALVLAAPGTDGQKWLRMGVGLLVLIPVQTWGVCFDMVKTMAFGLGPTPAIQLAETEREFVALGYQFGYLILPSVAPVVLWIALHQGFLRDLAPRLAGGR